MTADTTETRSGEWFALGSDGLLHALTTHDSFDSAERSAEITLPDQRGGVWIADEPAARQWLAVLHRRFPVRNGVDPERRRELGDVLYEEARQDSACLSALIDAYLRLLSDEEFEDEWRANMEEEE